MEAMGAPATPPEVGHVQLPEAKALGPCQCQPPIQYGKWVYPINQNHYACIASTPAIPNDPQTFQEAISSENSDHWKIAM
jgi:hypothetical protein